MKTADFDFDLPEDRIALRPAEPRDSARLLVVRDGGLWALIAVIATAYAAGAGTYTGIEALSNNAHALNPPRAQTGARAMALIATVSE